MTPIDWTLDNLERLGGHKVTVAGRPQLIDAPGGGKAVQFGGAADQLVIDANPLKGWPTFTLEVVFRPDAGGLPEQRFVHLQEDGTENRVMMETRLPPSGQWYADTYIRSGSANSALNDPQRTHALDQWHTMALVFDGRQMVQYVNGKKELARPVKFAPQGAGKVSLGARMNQVHWFKGAIRQVRFTPGAVDPKDMLRAPRG